jgi:hypothetical protein
MVSDTIFSHQRFLWEGDAPAEPLPRKARTRLGRSLALQQRAVGSFSQIAFSVNTGQRRSTYVNLRQPILLLLSDGNRLAGGEIEARPLEVRRSERA